MNFYNEYKTRNGLPFYSEWAFAASAQEMYEANMAALDEYAGRYCTPRYNESVEDCVKENPDKLVYFISNHGYARNTYAIAANPENLSMEEIALIVDHGNLCFGFYGSQSYIDIYTD